MRRSGHVFAVLVLAGVVGLFAWALGLRIDRQTLTFNEIIELVPTLGIALVATVLIWKRPGNLVGWILAALGIAGAFVEATSALFEPSPDRPLSGIELAMITIDRKLFLANFGLVAALFHTFPTGRTASPIWRKVARVTFIAFVLMALQFAFDPGPVDNELPPGPANPLNPIGVTGPVGTALRVLGTAATPVFLIGGLVGGVASIVHRYRRAGLVERLQLKWFAATAAIFGSFLLLNVFLRGTDLVSIEVLDVALSVMATGFPVAIGVSVLRYRLYDIDRIISRTVAYTIVTALLGGTFALIVLLPTQLVGADTPDYVIAAATLVVAALFGPVRRRVQNAVDRRFNRARYDASRTIEAFATRLREQVDIDALGAELQDIVIRTMQPSHVSLWRP